MCGKGGQSLGTGRGGVRRCRGVRGERQEGLRSAEGAGVGRVVEGGAGWTLEPDRSSKFAPAKNIANHSL